MRNELLAIFVALVSLSMLSCSVQCRTASLEIGDSFYKEVYLVKGSRFLKKTISNGKLKEQFRVKLTEEEVRCFWEIIEESQVTKWNSVYLPTEVTERTAITSWAIELHFNGLVTRVGGGGAFPSDEDYSKPVGPDFSDRFLRVESAFAKLQNEATDGNTKHVPF
jgi:hypothetical protein